MNTIHMLNKRKTNAPEGEKGIAWALFMQIHVQFCQQACSGMKIVCALNEEENSITFSLSKKTNAVLQFTHQCDQFLLHQTPSWSCPFSLGCCCYVKGLTMVFSLIVAKQCLLYCYCCSILSLSLSLFSLSVYEVAVFVTSRCLGSAYTFAAVFHKWGVIPKKEITSNTEIHTALNKSKFS